MLPQLARHRRRLVLCADFDETLTARDTIALLFQCAGARLSDSAAQAAHAAHVQVLVTRFSSELQALDRAHLPSLPTRRFDAAGLRSYLNLYAAVDLRSVRRVEHARLLGGIVPARDLVALAANIALQPDAMSTLALADAAHVVSSNWSAVMLEAAVNGARQDSARVRVVTNDLEVDADGVTTGKIHLRVQSPSDKAEWVERIRADEAAAAAVGDDIDGAASKPLLVFVGDSANDLLAMAAADVGVSLKSGADSSLERLATRFGVSLEPLASMSLVDCERVSQEARAQGEQVVFTARSWAEIASAVTSCDVSSADNSEECV